MRKKDKKLSKYAWNYTKIVVQFKAFPFVSPPGLFISWAIGPPDPTEELSFEHRSKSFRKKVAPPCSWVKWLCPSSHTFFTARLVAREYLLRADTEGKPKNRTESKDRVAIKSRVTLMGRSRVGLSRQFKVPVRDCEYSDTQHRSDLANEFSQRETTMLEP